MNYVSFSIWPQTSLEPNLWPSSRKRIGLENTSVLTNFTSSFILLSYSYFLFILSSIPIYFLIYYISNNSSPLTTKHRMNVLNKIPEIEKIEIIILSIKGERTLHKHALNLLPYHVIQFNKHLLSNNIPCHME